MKRSNNLIKTTGYLVLLITMLFFTTSCENNVGFSKWVNGNGDKIYGEWVVVKARDNGFNLSLITYAKNDSLGRQWLASTLLKEDEYKDLKLLNDSRFKVQMVTSVFIKQDEFTDLEPGKEYDYTVRREAGTLALHGKITGTRGSGDFEFTPDQTFIDYFQEQGYERITVDKALRLFMGNSNKAYFNELRALGFDHLPMDKFSDFAIHGASIPFIKDIHDQGYKDISPSLLVEFRKHGVSPEFIREIHEVGFRDISPDKLVEFRKRGVSPQFIREIHDTGFRDISPDKLIDFRWHGVSPEYIREIQQAGFKDISPDKVIVFRRHDVTSQNEEHKATEKEGVSSEKAMGMINNGSLIDNEQGLQLSNSKREISMFPKGWNLTLSRMIHTDNIIELHFQSTGYKAEATFIVEPHIGSLPDSKEKTWDILKQNYKNYTIRPESWEYGEIDGLPSTTYIADYDKAGKNMIEYCTYILNKQYLGLFELHVEKKVFDRVKTGFDRMVQSLKWKNK